MKNNRWGRYRSLPRYRFWFVLLGVLAALSGSQTAVAQLSPGPLSRAHKSLEGSTNCVQCHSLSRAPMSTSCLNCHKDVKLLLDQQTGFHARLPAGQRLQCASCHPDHAGADFSLIAWPNDSRTKFDHRQAGWPLDGKHLETRCESCHSNKFRVAPAAALSKRQSGTPWIGFERTCANCHRTDDAHDGALKSGCDNCHDAKAWTAAPKFRHADARFQLTGKHADVKCDACHRAARLTLKVDSAGKKLALFRPLVSARCSDCHADPHKGRIRESCTTCHQTTGWATIDKRGFNHNATRYPLLGKHARVTCASCHGAGNERTAPAFATCGSCHADPHRGEAGTSRDCAACHRVEGFAPVTFTVADHAKTAYPLAGKHLATPCKSCHTTSFGSSARPADGSSSTMGYVRLKVTAASCGNCHVDAHAGQPAVQAAANSCAACHSVNGFLPSTVSVATHASFRFALDGAHVSTTCAACHSVERKGLPTLTVATGKAKFAFALADTGCASCHSDPHAGRYVAGGARASLSCRSCHSTTNFRASTITPESHKSLGYALEGAHRAVACAECHLELRAPHATSSLKLLATGQPALPFKQARASTCAGCHSDVHNSQFSQRKDKGACEGCHVVARFAGAEKFNHERDTKFGLVGAHAQVACARCHAVTAGAGATTPESARRRYVGVSSACESCHAPTRKEAR